MVAMWTPKRIVLLSACFVAFFGVYLGYAWTAIGSIDGLPPLPEVYWPVEGDPSEELPPPGGRNSNLQKKLIKAFGHDAKELKWPIRLDIHSRNMVLAAADFKVESGRVVLTPLSVAMIGKDKHDGLPEEINTIRGNVAYLTFDRPVTNFSEISSRKITKAELTGHIQVVNNRRRAERDEDLRVNIDTGTLYYEEDRQRIWTEGLVKLEDFKGKPRPHLVKGKGMEMLLLAESAPQRPGGPRKNDRSTITGVKWITLGSNVDMKLYIDGQSSLMVSAPPPTSAKPSPAAAEKDKGAKPAPAPAQKSELHITTPGHFRFDLLKDYDVAQFDVLPAGPSPAPAAPALQPRHVEVKRTNLETKVTDHLVCRHLTLKLVRHDGGKEPGKAKPPAAANGKAPPPEARGEAVEIQELHAVGPDKGVVLVSNADHLVACGRDFFHDAVKQYTVLKGSPVDVTKEDNIIHARELRIQNVKPAEKPPPGRPEPKARQDVTALGPGDILFEDKKEGKKLNAYWQDVLTLTKDGELDLLVLTGKARFLDQQAEQSLSADTIKVWLEEVEKKQATPRGAEQPTDSRRPRHLEATGHVVTRSRDMNVHDTSRLVVWFKDVPGVDRVPPPPGRDTRVPAATVPGRPAPAEPIPPSLPRPLPQGTTGPAGLTSRPGAPRPAVGPAPEAPQNQPPPRPFDLSARSVEAWVLRSPEKSALDQLWCEGTVHVKQDPATPEEKGTEVKGDTLRMTAKGEGNYDLVVTGDLGELLTDKIYIIGPEINIDQATNKAWVIGDGAMKMDSKTNFQGEELAKPVPLTVHWSKSMLFHGEWAEFHGNIQAVQEKARMACQRLQVYFDRPISLKEGNKDGPSPQVKHLVCDREVRIEDSTFEGERLVKYQRLEGPCVQMRALEPEEAGGKPAPPTAPGEKRKASGGNVVNASGPGNIRIWEPNNGEDPLGPAQGQDGKRRTSAKPAAPAVPEMRMTYVAFGGHMNANSKTNTAQFWWSPERGLVQVLHLPWPRHDAPLDLDAILSRELPEKALYIRCERLKVLDRPESDGRPNKQMEGHGRVYIQGEDFWARGDAVYYNHLKQQVIIEGGESGNATLYRVPKRGAEENKVEAKRILYNRATGKTDVMGASSVSGESAPSGPPKQPPQARK
jgi:hypothetical protein